MKIKKYDYITIGVWEPTRRGLRMASAITGESIVVLLERLVASELKRLSVKDERIEDGENIRDLRDRLPG